jgi:hypothetical protein
MPIVSITIVNCRLAEDRADHEPLERTVPKHGHAAIERDAPRARTESPGSSSPRGRRNAAEHHQFALHEADGLGRLVDQHEAQRDQAVDAAIARCQLL